MIKTIYKPKLAEILPSSIKQDAEIHAAAEALDAEIEKILSKVEVALHLPRLEELPSEVLDHLAYQYHCDFFSQEFTEAVKRKQIKESLLWHRLKGTAVGVEKAIATFMTGAKVEENWEYGGEPYFFRITCKGLKYLSTEPEFIELINTAKNVRSWLEGIIFDLTIEEPQELVHAIAELETGLEVTDIYLEKQIETHNLVQGIGELVLSYEVTDLVGGEVEPVKTYYHAIAELEYGKEVTELEEPEPHDDYWFEWWIAQKWKNWKVNPLLKHYPHEDEEILPPEPDVFPEGDFLRLYFYFPNKSIRYITMLNPRDNLSVSDIKSVAVWWKNLLQNSAGYTSIAVIKALLVKKDIYKIL